MKKKTNDEKIVDALDALDNAIRKLQKYGARFDKMIDEAALSNNDEMAKRFIRQKIKVYNSIQRFTQYKSYIEYGVYTTQAYSQLAKLPAALKGMEGLLASTPDFTKIEKSMEKIFADIAKSESSLDKLNDALDPQPVDTLSSRLDGTDSVEESDQFKAEYAAMIERIKGAVNPEAVAKPAAEAATATGDIDYAGIIREENDKKD